MMDASLPAGDAGRAGRGGRSQPAQGHEDEHQGLRVASNTPFLTRIACARFIFPAVMYCTLPPKVQLQWLLLGALALHVGGCDTWAVIVDTSRYWFNFRCVMLRGGVQAEILISMDLIENLNMCRTPATSRSRHAVNALTVYGHVRRLGVPDDHVVLMVAEHMGCNARARLPGCMHHPHHGTDLLPGM